MLMKLTIERNSRRSFARIPIFTSFRRFYDSKKLSGKLMLL
jgi:hypothetical protein